MECDGGAVIGLIDATISRDVRKVGELVRSGVDPCTPTKDGTAPLHKAALLESPSGPSIVSTMLSLGADPNTKTSTGLSPLHIAAMWGRVETIDVLLDNGADVAIKDLEDMSPLDYADYAEDYRYECMDALTQYRGFKDVSDTRSHNSIDTAVESPRGESGHLMIDEELELYMASESIVYDCDNRVDYDSSETKSDATLTDVSDLSDNESDAINSDDSSSESFWSVSSVPFANHSRDPTLLSVNSNMRDLTLSNKSVGRARRNLTKELNCEKVEKLNPPGATIPRNDTVILACDLQERYRSTIAHFYEVCCKAQYFLSAASRLDIPTIITENHFGDNGASDKKVNTNSAKVFQRTSFSCVTDQLKDYLIKLRGNNGLFSVILFGFEAHISIQQTALALAREGYTVYIIADLTSSKSYDDRMFAFENMRQHGCIITTCESILFTLLQDDELDKLSEINSSIADAFPNSDEVSAVS